LARASLRYAFLISSPVADTGSGLAEADIPEDEAGQTGPEGVGVVETDAETDQPPHF
jgi:hypothetical protein